MSVPGIEAAGFTPYAAPRIDADPAGSSASTSASTSAGSSAATSTDGASFGNLVLDGIDKLQGAQQQSDSLAVKAATGDLQSIHDYTIAATQAQVMTQVTTAVRNKAIEAFNEIMRMQV